MVSTNKVFERYERTDTKLTVRKLNRSTVLIEGNREGLEFLGNLLLTYARSNEHSVQIPPSGAGMKRFTNDSNLGFYLHRLPCSSAKDHDRPESR